MYKRIVYITRSDADQSRHFVGLTSNLRDEREPDAAESAVPNDKTVGLTYAINYRF